MDCKTIMHGTKRFCDYLALYTWFGEEDSEFKTHTSVIQWFDVLVFGTAVPQKTWSWKSLDWNFEDNLTGTSHMVCRVELVVAITLCQPISCVNSSHGRYYNVLIKIEKWIIETITSVAFLEDSVSCGVYGVRPGYYNWPFCEVSPSIRFLQPPCI